MQIHKCHCILNINPSSRVRTVNPDTFIRNNKQQLLIKGNSFATMCCLEFSIHCRSGPLKSYKILQSEFRGLGEYDKLLCTDSDAMDGSLRSTDSTFFEYSGLQIQHTGVYTYDTDVCVYQLLQQQITCPRYTV